MPATTQPNPDPLLTTAFLQGDQKAFGRVYDEYAPMLYGFISKLTQDKKQADQVLQQCFIALWQGRSAMQAQPAAVLGSLIRTARQLATNGGQLGESVEIITQNENRGPSDYVNNHTPDTNDAKVQQLSSAVQDKALELMYLLGKSPQEVATCLNITPVAVKGAVRCAINRFKGDKQ